MKIIEEVCKGDITYSFPYPKENILFFDIETTGFAAETSALYLIGVAYYKEHTWKILQWFADDYSSEKQILVSFFAFLQKFQLLVSFNGNTFDMPFLKKKCEQHQLTDAMYSFEHVESLDLYKEIFKHRKRLKLENMKQKTLERFININRKDIYSGKELIKIYQKYVGEHVRNENADTKEMEELLLLHNRDDVAGMLQFSNLKFLSDLLNGKSNFKSITCLKQGDIIVLDVTLDFYASAHYQWRGANVFLDISDNSLRLVVSCLEARLKLFFDNYKEYYYLPKEDRAVHKSIGMFVDKEYRQRAKKENCYSWEEGLFIPVYSKYTDVVFREKLDGDEQFIKIDTEFLENKEKQEQYVNDFLENCLELCLEKN